MSKQQLDAWTGSFGSDYLARNSDISEENIAARARALAAMLEACAEAPRSILEVGANIGRNLMALRRNTDTELHAVEPFREAYNKLLQLLGPDLAGSACTGGQSLPYEDASIDLVFTSGVLIHIGPEDLPAVMSEIVRVSRRYVWCNEYFAKNPEELSYRDEKGLLFKRDFGRYYLELFPGLKPVQQGFLWSKTTPFDDTTWWLFEKTSRTE